MPEKHRRKDTNPQTTWLAYADQVPSLVKALLEQGFKKLEPSSEAQKTWANDYFWYYDDLGNKVTIENARRKGERLITCTRGARPIVSDTFAGLDAFRRPLNSDY